MEESILLHRSTTGTTTWYLVTTDHQSGT